MELSGAHILITGGASGLGEASARHLAAAGAEITVCDRDAERGEAVAAAVGGHFVRLDVTDPGAGEVIVAANARAPLRGLVSCAGIGTAARIVGRDGPMPLDAFARVVQVNLVGMFNMMRLVAAAMAGNAPLANGERGVIVNTASVAAFDGQLGQAAYAASKGGIVSLALPAARELARFGIRVNTIAPGVFVTPLLGELSEPVRDKIAAAIPFPPRLGEPAEFAHAVRFAFENTYLNAEVIRLDGATRLPPQ